MGGTAKEQGKVVEMNMLLKSGSGFWRLYEIVGIAWD